MMNKLKARLSNAKSHPLPNTKATGNDDDDDEEQDQPSLVHALSATLKNPKRLISQKEMVHAILLGIKGTDTKLLRNKTNEINENEEIDLIKLSIDELQKICKSYIKIECPSCGSDNTAPHKYSNFDFEIYASSIFQSLRKHFKIQNEIYSNDFLYKLCGVSTIKKQETELNVEQYTSFWKPLITNSKSGQLFYKTKDSLFIIKSMSKKECNFLRNNLYKYYKYMIQNKDSLICQFLGLYKVNIQYQKAVFLLIQKSVLYSYPQKLKMNKLYDLKGSTFNRQATRWKVEIDADDMEKISNSIRSQQIDAMVDEIKDIDYNESADLDIDNHFDEQFSPSFYVPDISEANSLKNYKSSSVTDDDEKDKKDNLEPDVKGGFFKRSKILKDLDFLKDKQRIIIGKKRKKLWLDQLEKDTKFLTELNVMDYSLLMGMHYKSDIEQKENSNGNKQRWIDGELFNYDHGGMSYNEMDETTIDESCDNDELEPSWSDENGLKDQLKNTIYFAGIIDILQPYNARKKVEHFMLGFKTDKTTVSAVSAEVYSKRLLEFMKMAVH